jgi:hypothetical protein
MLAFIQQYLAYVIIALILALVVSNGVWFGVHWYDSQKITTLEAQVKQKDAELAQRDALIEGFAQKTAEVAKRVADANAQAAKSQAKHQAEMEALFAEKFPDTQECNRLTDFALDRMPKVLTPSWTQ